MKWGSGASEQRGRRMKFGVFCGFELTGMKTETKTLPLFFFNQTFIVILKTSNVPFQKKKKGL